MIIKFYGTDPQRGWRIGRKRDGRRVKVPAGASDFEDRMRLKTHQKTRLSAHSTKRAIELAAKWSMPIRAERGSVDRVIIGVFDITLTITQAKALKALARFQEEREYPAGLQDLADSLKGSKQAAKKVLDILERKGCIARDSGINRSTRILRPDLAK